MTDMEMARADIAIIRAALELRTAELVAADALLRTLNAESCKLRERSKCFEHIARELVFELRVNGANTDLWLQKIEEAVQ